MTVTDDAAPVRVGVIVPSSNTVVEPELCRLVGPKSNVCLHFTRVRVTEIDLGSQATAQFDSTAISEAASLLGDALPNVVVWAGTSGSWLGLDQERSLVAAMSSAAGVPATTTTLAVLEACRTAGYSRVALVTPYVEPVVRMIVQTLETEGVQVVAEAHLGLTDNHSFGLVEPPQIRRMVDACNGSDALALLVLCTNLRAAALVDELAHRSGLAVLDSVAQTLSHTVSLAAQQPIMLAVPRAPA